LPKVILNHFQANLLIGSKLLFKSEAEKLQIRKTTVFIKNGDRSNRTYGTGLHEN
jgi:hypothetical protein